MEYEYRPERLEDVLPARQSDSHKGTYGKVLVIAGSKNMCGAAYLCAKAAYRTGAGLVCIYTEECNRVILQQLIPEAVLITYEREHWEPETLSRAMEDKTAVAAGPGLGVGEIQREILRLLLREKMPRVLDADALNLLARDKELLDGAAAPFIITPHAGEMARLTGRPAEEIAADAAKTAGQYAREHRVVTVLKGAPTVTADGADCFWNTTGNHGMSTGGSGDVLTGIIAGLLAQGMPLFEAAKLGVYLHGLAGDAARDARGAYAMMAGDMLDYILRGV